VVLQSAYDPNDTFGSGAHKWGTTLTGSEFHRLECMLDMCRLGGF